jgi:murein DD-endopeptidase MepM/ murein hydrolase activator NlpD
MSVFVSLDETTTKPTDNSEILYAAIKLGSVTRKFYRFRDPDSGAVDYYDENGKSVKKFLLRKPVPNGRFTSPFGMRYHPILKTRTMHWGIDWGAPRGTPIIAAGDGVVEKAGWGKGSGRETIIRHANGYETAYFHQSRIAVKKGQRVRQGQIIGYVGSTGLSTGPHLHYEVHVNGNRVDPMRIRLPKGKELDGQNLKTFIAERERIDDLLAPQDETKLAQY